MSEERAVTRKATGPTRLGARTTKRTVVPAPGLTSNGCVAFTTPNSEESERLLSGSRISSATCPFIGRSPASFTTTAISAVSPSRRKRGR